MLSSLRAEVFRAVLFVNPFQALCRNDAALAGDYLKSALAHMAAGDDPLTAAMRAVDRPGVGAWLDENDIDILSFTTEASRSIAKWHAEICMTEQTHDHNLGKLKEDLQVIGTKYDKAVAQQVRR